MTTKSNKKSPTKATPTYEAGTIVQFVHPSNTDIILAGEVVKLTNDGSKVQVKPMFASNDGVTWRERSTVVADGEALMRWVLLADADVMPELPSASSPKKATKTKTTAEAPAKVAKGKKAAAVVEEVEDEDDDSDDSDDEAIDEAIDYDHLTSVIKTGLKGNKARKTILADLAFALESDDEDACGWSDDVFHATGEDGSVHLFTMTADLTVMTDYSLEESAEDEDSDDEPEEDDSDEDEDGPTFAASMGKKALRAAAIADGFDASDLKGKSAEELAEMLNANADAAEELETVIDESEEGDEDEDEDGEDEPCIYVELPREPEDLTKAQVKTALKEVCKQLGLDATAIAVALGVIREPGSEKPEPKGKAKDEPKGKGKGKAKDEPKGKGKGKGKAKDEPKIMTLDVSVESEKDDAGDTQRTLVDDDGEAITLAQIKEATGATVKDLREAGMQTRKDMVWCWASVLKDEGTNWSKVKTALKALGIIVS